MAILITSQTTEEAIQKAGVTRNTAYKWLGDSDFQRELRDANRTAFVQATSKLSSATSKSVNTLMEIQDDEDATATAKVAAAKAILDFAYNAIQADDLLKRIEEIEQSQRM